MKNTLADVWFGNNQEVDILVNGRPIKVYGAEGKSFIEARHGAQYSIKLRNNHSHRVLALVSVDGLDVLTGKPATDDSGGYIINACSTYEVKGFRVSDDAVNKFEFADKEKSYAKLGEDGEQSTANCGVIAVRFIHEKERAVFVKKHIVPDWPDWPEPRPPKWPRSPEWPRPPYEPIWSTTTRGDLGDGLRDSDMSTVKCMSFSADRGVTRSRAGGCSAGEFDMGTKFSEERVDDRVTTTTFERGNDASSHTFYYASRSQLEAFGVEFEPKAKVTFPVPFKQGNYCKPPRRR